METLPLTEVPRAIKMMTGGKTVKYSTLYRHIIDGDLDAVKTASGQWVVRREDLPRILAAFGLTAEGG